MDTGTLKELLDYGAPLLLLLLILHQARQASVAVWETVTKVLIPEYLSARESRENAERELVRAFNDLSADIKSLLSELSKKG